VQTASVDPWCNLSRHKARYVITTASASLTSGLPKEIVRMSRRGLDVVLRFNVASFDSTHGDSNTRSG
jgi:hypothetical protein